jgi:hypothetical protein
MDYQIIRKVIYKRNNNSRSDFPWSVDIEDVLERIEMEVMFKGEDWKAEGGLTFMDIGNSIVITQVIRRKTSNELPMPTFTIKEDEVEEEVDDELCDNCYEPIDDCTCDICAECFEFMDECTCDD